MRYENPILRGFNPVGQVFPAAGQYQSADVLTASEKLSGKHCSDMAGCTGDQVQFFHDLYPL